MAATHCNFHSIPFALQIGIFVSFDLICFCPIPIDSQSVRCGSLVFLPLNMDYIVLFFFEAVFAGQSASQVNSPGNVCIKNVTNKRLVNNLYPLAAELSSLSLDHTLPVSFPGRRYTSPGLEICILITVLPTRVNETWRKRLNTWRLSGF